MGNNGDGIVLEDVDIAVIRDYIIYYNTNGIVVRHSANITIENTKIGTNAAGDADLGNTNDGVRFENVHNGLIRNSIISGNGGDGVEFNTGSNNNVVEGNRIGTNAAGDAAIENFLTGVFLSNSSNNVIRNNLISGNRVGGFTAGLYIEGSGGLPAENNQVRDNLIGTNAAGAAALPNRFDGVAVFNAASNTIGPGNLISGNSGDGVRIGGVFSTDNLVTGNRIGTDATGTLDLGNTGDGVKINQGATETVVGIDQETLEAFFAVDFFRRPRIAELRIPPLPADLFAGNLFAGNLISGNNSSGVEISTIVVNQLPAQNIVQGNFIGVTLAGDAALPNTGNGVQIGSTLSGVGATDNIIRLNLISGNTGAGVLIARNANDNDIISNLIGTQADGTSALGNGSHGVSIDGGSSGNSGNEVSGNTIASNNGDGVFVQNSTKDSINGNAIFSNSDLGIDLSPNGVTANDAGDADTGANNLQNFPVITSAVTDGDTVIQGTLNSTPNKRFLIQFFANPTTFFDTTMHGEGRYFVGATERTTDESGNASFNVNTSALSLDSVAPVPSGYVITATATCLDGDGNPTDTSEFSRGVTVTGNTARANLFVRKTASNSQPAPGEDFTYTITVTNNGPDAASDVFVFDPLPEEVDFISCQTSVGTCRGVVNDKGRTIILGHIGTLASGASATVTVAVETDPSLIFRLFRNQAIAQTGTPDPDFDNNASTVYSRVFDVTRADLELVKGDSPDMVAPGGDITYTITVINRGPDPARDITLTDAIPFNTTIRAVTGQPPGSTCNAPSSGNTGTVKCDLPQLEPGASATFTVVVRVNDSAPVGRFIINSATVDAATIDPNEDNNTAAATSAVSTATPTPTPTPSPTPTLSLNDVSVNEGNSGTTNAVFQVTLSSGSGQPISVNFATADGTATAPSDYAATSGALTFNPGETSKTITVMVVGDTSVEPDETFFVNLSSPTNATITDSQGRGTIINDDAPPAGPTVQFSAAKYTVVEDCTDLEVTVTLTGSPSAPVKVNYATASGTASDRSDFNAASGALDFAPGEMSKSFRLLINEDSFVEGAEMATVTLTNPTGAALGTPAVATIEITDDSPEPLTNPLDEARTLVCQQYHDFLSRQPDPAGFDFWTNEITSCGTDAQCREVKRINVSAAFYLSIEFQETGYLVYRFYKAAFGDSTSPGVPGTVSIIRRQEFLPDTQAISQGVQVGIGDWQQQLEANKQAYALAFVRRQRFLDAYPASLTPAQFVDGLNAKAGGVLSMSERDQLVSELAANNTEGGRAVALRRVAEDEDLRRSEFNRAFVLMQYYGYLRRNPDDPQDVDFGGWKFWLDKLNQFNGNFIQAEMVKAFLSSLEYRARFGQ